MTNLVSITNLKDTKSNYRNCNRIIKMSSFINNENRQFQPRSAMARKKKLTREEQLAIWKKKRAEKNKQKRCKNR